MSVVRTAKSVPVRISAAATLIALVGLAGCGQNASSQGQAAASPSASTSASSSVPAATQASTEAPEASNAVGPAPIDASAHQSVPVQTAQAAAAPTVQTAEPVGDSAASSPGDIPDHTPAPTLSAEQQELAAEVGDTRHASADAASDKTPDQP